MTTEAAWVGALYLGFLLIAAGSACAQGGGYIDGKRVAITGVFQGDVHGDVLQANQDNVVPTTDGLDNVRHELQRESGAHAIRIEVTPDSSHSPVQLRLNWYPPDQRRADHVAAIEAARHARVAVVFLGTALTDVRAGR
jgi:beta-glucosidase